MGAAAATNNVTMQIDLTKIYHSIVIVVENDENAKCVPTLRYKWKVAGAARVTGDVLPICSTLLLNHTIIDWHLLTGRVKNCTPHKQTREHNFQ